MKKLLFCAIVLLAIALRFSFLATVPPSPSLDEVTIGWNGYSLMQTGKDEFGYHLPILLRAYDDYRPAAYVYLTIPFIKLLGLNVFSVRLPAAILSLAAIIMSFFLIRSMFAGYKKRDSVAFIGMLLFSISPWDVYTSHLGHEVNLGLTLVIFASMLFFLALEYRKGLLLSTAFGAFALSFYGYQSEKVFTPLLLLTLCIVYYRQLLSLKKYVVFGVILAALITLPIFLASVSPQALLRLKGVSVFSDNPAYDKSAQALVIAKKQHNIVGEILDNRRITTVDIFVQNYILHFNAQWLFGNSNGNELFKAPNEGLFYVWEAPFILLGLLFLLFNKAFSKKTKIVTVAWILFAFVPSAIATQAPQAMRSITLLPIPEMAAALGVLALSIFLQKYTSRVITLCVIAILALFVISEFGQFARNYFVVFPIQQSESFQYSFKDAMQYVQVNRQKYQHVVVYNNYLTSNLYQTYMFYLYYSKYDPKAYLAHGGTISGGFNAVHTVDNITFRPIDYLTEKPGTLLVGSPNEFPQNIQPLFTSYNLDGTIGMIAVVR